MILENIICTLTAIGLYKNIKEFYSKVTDQLRKIFNAAVH